ncbi:serine hydrolase [Saccharopolyspora taberi]|uniref:Serine hydrolase n=1 Tax=Saccharopolyspora taberi TaxID=60895 RepID=A0ABN3VCK7_9PSEU
MGFADRLRTALEPGWADFPGRAGFAAWDLEEREPVLFGAERVVHPASTIKVLIMLAALREVQEGRLALDAEVELPADRVGGSGVLKELPSVRQMSLVDLITLMIVISDNAATNAVVEAVGFAAINDRAAEFGCQGTQVQRLLMRVEDPGTNTTCALDQARILDRLATGAALSPELTRHALGVLARQQVRDRLPAQLPDGARCWNKTGELSDVRHDVALIGDDRPRAVVAVLVDELALAAPRVCARIAELGLRVFQSLG